MIEEIQKKLVQRKVHVLGHEQVRKSAVMLSLIYYQGEWCVLFEVRAKHLKRQPGEICFPGGKVDQGDRSEEETAIRETCEELGIRRDHIEVMGPLDVLVTPFHEMIYPFVCKIALDAPVTPNPDEVDEVFYVPLHRLKQMPFQRFDVHLEVKPSEDFPFERIPKGKYYNWRKGTVPEYFYEYKGRTIWGMTARILHHFLTVTKD